MGKKSVLNGIYFGQDHVKTFGKIMKVFAEDNNLTKRIQFTIYAEEGLKALREATPKDTGITADSWYYKMYIDKNKVSIKYYNLNINEDQNVAILIQYGHLTGNGYYVRGVDYINPALAPTFDKMANAIYKEVVRL